MKKIFYSAALAFIAISIVVSCAKKNTPSSNCYSANYGATIENTLDIETIGSWCSSSNVTIIMYLAQNNNFYGALSYAINSNVITNNGVYKPSVISISAL